MDWKVTAWDAEGSWVECAASDWAQALRTAEAMPEGEVWAERPDHSAGMTLAFDPERGLLVASGPEGLKRVAFPHHPNFGPSGALAAAPRNDLASHGFPRREAFALLGCTCAPASYRLGCRRPTRLNCGYPASKAAGCLTPSGTGSRGSRPTWRSALAAPSTSARAPAAAPMNPASLPSVA